jgi:peroxiredoxin
VTGGETNEWLLLPRLSRAQELVYRGTFTEEASGNGVQFSSAYRLESRVFVLDAPADGKGNADVALLTILKARANAPEHGEETAGSTRLELIQVEPQGRVKPGAGRTLSVPLEGPPTIEYGAFVEVPQHRVGMEQTWQVTEDGRSIRTWRVAGSDMVNGTSCLKLVGTQQSDDWDQPRADRSAWRREDTVWLAPRLGIAYRVERVIQRRDPARDKPNHRSVLRYELESSLPYPKALYEDRRDEIMKSHSFAESAAPLLANPGKYASQLQALLARINQHLEHQPRTPYRDAVVLVKHRVEAAARGESPPAMPSEVPVAAPATVAEIGAAAPDFLATDYGHRESARLHSWLGKPLVLVFYSPASLKATELLHFAQKVSDTHKQNVTVIGLVMSDDVERVRQQRDDLHITFPLLDGTGLRKSYAVEATPKIVVIDATGVVRGSFVGWGQETPASVLDELKHWLPSRP